MIGAMSGLAQRFAFQPGFVLRISHDLGQHLDEVVRVVDFLGAFGCHLDGGQEFVFTGGW